MFALQIGEDKDKSIGNRRQEEAKEDFNMLTVTKLNGKEMGKKKMQPKFFKDVQKKPYIKISVSKTAKSSSQTSANESRNSPRRSFINPPSPNKHSIPERLSLSPSK